MKTIDLEVRKMSFVEYDINVWTDEDSDAVSLVFYPLLYPGDEGYSAEKLFGSECDCGIPVADYGTSYVLRIPKGARGPRYREALAYLEKVVTYGSFGDVWSLDGMDWTSVENELDDSCALISEFRATLPRRDRTNGA